MQIQSQLVSITQGKISCDSLLSTLKRSYNHLCNLELSDTQIVQVKGTMTRTYNDIRIQCNKQTKSLSVIKQDLSQLKSTHNKDVTGQEIMYENLLEYFNHVKQSAKGLYDRISDKISELETLRLTTGGGKCSEPNEEESLMHSIRATRQATGMAEQVFKELNMQTSQLGKIRKKVGDLIGELNIGRTLIRIISNRSAEDYRLILILTAVLVLEILVCYFYIRPWWKG